MDSVYGQPETSQHPRVFLALGHTAAIAASAWILFALPPGIRALGTTIVATSPDRRVMLFFAALIYFVRVLGTAFIFLRRRMAWGEALTILVWVAFIHVWFALLGRSSKEPLGVLDVFSIALFLCGSYLNTGSEYARSKWKGRPENVGRLYTEGLFRWSRHINYFAEIAGKAVFVGLRQVDHRSWHLHRERHKAIRRAGLPMARTLIFAGRLSQGLHGCPLDESRQWTCDAQSAVALPSRRCL